MSDAILCSNAALTGFFSRFSFCLPAGSSAFLVTARPEETLQLCRVVAGTATLSSGHITVLGTELATASPPELLMLRQKTGIVTTSGGLVSNLKLWENILLPTLYHTGETTEEQQKEAERLLEFFDYHGNVMALPAKLTIFERRMAAFIRAAIQSPALMIYAGCFEGISEAHGKKLLSAATELNKSRQVSSLYLTSSPDFAALHDDIPCYCIHTDNGAYKVTS